MVATILMWILLQGAGWAMIWLPHVPEGFSHDPGVDPNRYQAWAEAAYISLVTLATLGFGDVVAVDPVLRVLSPLQGLTGFALLTAALTWFMQIHPPLSRRRAAALRLHGLRAAGYADRAAELPAWSMSQAVAGLAAELGTIGIDLKHYVETYFFHEDARPLSLAEQLHVALDLHRAAAEQPDPGVRAAAVELGAALDEITAQLREFVDGQTLPDVVAAYTSDHRQSAGSGQLR